jgi:hypothetical protein
MMKNIGEEVIKLTNEALVDINKSLLDKTQEKCIKSLIIDLSSKPLSENTVYKLLCKFLTNFF